MKRFFFGLLMAVLSIFAAVALTTPVKSTEPPEPIRIAAEIPEDYENQKIESALLAKAHRVENCTVTWYCNLTCGKSPDNPAYGITASGEPTKPHCTVATDTSVIPMYSDVCVEYADGTVEQLWATDTGVKGNAIDIYTPDYDYAIQCGRQSLTVWWVET